MKEFNPGEIFEGEVQITPRSKIGSIRLPGREKHFLTIGPVDCESGTIVRVQYMGGADWEDPGYGLCMTEAARADNYDEDFIQNIEEQILAESPPEPGVVALAKLDRVDEYGIGYIDFDEQEVCIGPVDESVPLGEVLELRGVGGGFARIKNSDKRGENYESRFAILTKNYQRLSLEPGEPIKTAIIDLRDDDPIGYVDDIPVCFPGADIDRARVVKGEIIGFEHDTAVADVVEITDEVRRLSEAGQWARLHWLKQAGFDEHEPLKHFAESFIGVPKSQLPDSIDQLKNALVAEAIRYALFEQRTNANEDSTRLHANALRHWVVRKLDALFEMPEEDDDWFRQVLTDGPDPSLTFTGDVIELGGGYYAPGKTRLVEIGEGEAALVSGEPTRQFLGGDFEIEIRGHARVVTNIDEGGIPTREIPVQPRERYLNTDVLPIRSPEDLWRFVEQSAETDIEPEVGWRCYQINTGYRYEWEDPLVETTLNPNGAKVSLWSDDPEHGQPTYWLQYSTASDESNYVLLPNRRVKEACLALNKAAGRPRQADLLSRRDGVELRCGFNPPGRMQRWLNVIGAQWLEPTNDTLRWQIHDNSVSSVQAVFEQFPITVNNQIN